jgi:hypothetical protein
MECKTWKNTGGGGFWIPALLEVKEKFLLYFMPQ